jgi:hypothetical protein
MRGNGGSTGGASLPLPPNTRGHPMAVHRAVTHRTSNDGLGLGRETKVARLDRADLGHEDGLRVGMASEKIEGKRNGPRGGLGRKQQQNNKNGPKKSFKIQRLSNQI